MLELILSSTNLSGIKVSEAYPGELESESQERELKTKEKVANGIPLSNTSTLKISVASLPKRLKYQHDSIIQISPKLSLFIFFPFFQSWLEVNCTFRFSLIIMKGKLFNFYMKINKGDKILDFKTGNSQESNIDVFSKMQVSFLQKFFKCNLSDYFPEYFINIYEDVFDRKINHKSEKGLATSLFIAKQPIPIGQLQGKLQNFYKSKSKSLSEGHLSCAFKKLYSNSQKQEVVIKQEEIILIDVKIKVQVQKIQEVPQKILNYLASFKNPKKENLTQIQEILQNYHEQYFNVFFVYFGDINFNLFNKKKYQIETIKIMGNTYKFRIFVFFVSKQGLLETFTTLNKIENLEVINDLVVQFYMIKRIKQKQKRNKQVQQVKKLVPVKQHPEYTHIAFGVIGVISLTVFGIAIKKLFF